MKQALKNFFSNPTRIVALIALVFLILALVACDDHDHAPTPESQSKIGATATLYTVEHDNHMFVVFCNGSQGGLTHHPDCLDRDNR